MGLESACSLVRGRARIAGKGLLESDHILFRGDGEREKVMLAAIIAAEASDGTLTLTHRDGMLKLALPDDVAERWLAKIRNPRSLLDKLGVKQGMRVSVLGIADDGFLTQLRQRTSDVGLATRPATDIIFLGAESVQDLTQLPALRKAIVPNGAIWIVHRKGKEATLRDVDVFAAAKRAGLVDTKVAAFSSTQTAEKLVIPLGKR